MIEQDNESFNSRVSHMMFEAVIEAGRLEPDNEDLDRTLNAMADAMTSVAVMNAMLPEMMTSRALSEDERECVALALEEQADRLSSRLNLHAARVRSGAFSVPPLNRPKPRLVK